MAIRDVEDGGGKGVEAKAEEARGERGEAGGGGEEGETESVAPNAQAADDEDAAGYAQGDTHGGAIRLIEGLRADDGADGCGDG